MVSITRTWSWLLLSVTTSNYKGGKVDRLLHRHQERQVLEVGHMETRDIENVLKLARVELDDGRAERKAETHADFEQSCEAVEMWLREIGVLPPR